MDVAYIGTDFYKTAIKGNSGAGGNGVQGVVESSVGSQWMRGIYGRSKNTGGFNVYGVGVLGQAEGAANWDNTYGVYAEATKGHVNYGAYSVADAYGGYAATGIYAQGLGATTINRAGFFMGDVVVTGACACSPSDEKLKTNIRPFEKGLNVIMALRTKAYDMRVEEFKGRLALAEGPQVGLIAQDVEKLVPEAVMPVHVPERESKTAEGIKKVEAIDYKSLNYDVLIPVLINAIQEQQAQIEVLNAKLAENQK
jgi:hypothetical protein